MVRVEKTITIRRKIKPGSITPTVSKGVSKLIRSGAPTSYSAGTRVNVVDTSTPEMKQEGTLVFEKAEPKPEADEPFKKTVTQSQAQYYNQPLTPIQQQTSSYSASASTSQPLSKPYYPEENMTWWEKAKYAGKKYTSKETYQKAGQALFGTGENQAPFTNFFSTLTEPLKVFTFGRAGEYSVNTNPLKIATTPPGFKTTEVLTSVRKDNKGYEKLAEMYAAEPSVIQDPTAVSQNVAKEVRGSLEPKYVTAVEERGKYYQSKIDTGEIEYDTAVSEYDTFVGNINKQYEKEFGKVYTEKATPLIEKNVAFSQAYARANKPAVNVPKLAEIGGIVGLSLAAPVTASAFIGSSGLATTYEGMVERNPVKLFGGAAAFGLGTNLALSTVAQQVDVAKLENLGEQKVKIIGQERIRGSKGSLYDFTGIQSAGREASVKTTLRMPVFRAADGSLRYTGVVGKTTGKYFSFAYDKWMPISDSFKIQAVGYTSPGYIIKQGDFGYSFDTGQASYGRGMFIRDDTLSSFTFGGVSKDFAKGYKIITTTPTSARFYESGKTSLVGAPTGYGYVTKGIMTPEAQKLFTLGGYQKVSAPGLLQSWSGASAGGSAITSQSLQFGVSSSIPRVATASVSALGLGYASLPVSKQKTIPAMALDLQPTQITRPRLLQAQVPAVAQRLGSRTTQVLTPYTPAPLTPVTPTPNVPGIYTPFFALPFFSFGGGAGGIGSGKVKSKGFFKYTPSYTALVYGIKGKQPKIKQFKGFELRPITSSWKGFVGLRKRRK